MVWSQYVYEASAGTEAAAHSSDDDAHTDSEDTLLNIHGFYDAYSDDLWFLYDTLRQLLADAYREHEFDDLEFHDWLEFCFHETDRVPHESTDLKYIWSVLTREDQSGMLQRKTLGDFEEFLLGYSIP